MVWWHCESRFNPSLALVVSQKLKKKLKKELIIEIDQRNCFFIYFKLLVVPKALILRKW